MKLDLDNRVVAITGGAGGIGRAVCMGFAAQGASVAILDRDLDGAQATLNAIDAAGGKGIALSCDISDRDSAKQAAASVAQRLGPVDVLINNAGMLIGAPVDDDAFDDKWDMTRRVNVDGPMNMVRAFLSQLRQTRGAIISVSSSSAQLASRGSVMYATSKAAVSQLTRALAVDLGPDGIRVNAVAPGVVKTPINIAFTGGVDMTERYLPRTPLGVIAGPEDLVGPFLFLASALASHMTGTILPVDGGYTATGFIAH